jgi:hypothetical protein
MPEYRIDGMTALVGTLKAVERKRVRRLMAAHEACHAVVAHALEFRVKWVSINPSGKDGGRVVYSAPVAWLARDLDEVVEDEIVATLAGMLGSWFVREPDGGDLVGFYVTDYESAFEYLDELLGLGRDELPDDVLVPYSERAGRLLGERSAAVNRVSEALHARGALYGQEVVELIEEEDP